MNTVELLVATLKHMKVPYQLLLIPLTIFSGLEQSFFGGDFTQVKIFVYYLFKLLIYLLLHFVRLFGYFDSIWRNGTTYFHKFNCNKNLHHKVTGNSIH